MFSNVQTPLPGRRSASLWTSSRRRAPRPARSRDAAHPRAHRCWSGNDRRAHLGGTERVEDRRLEGRGVDRPACVRRGASVRGERCSKRVSPRAAGLKKLRSIRRYTFLFTLILSALYLPDTRHEKNSVSRRAVCSLFEYLTS